MNINDFYKTFRKHTVYAYLPALDKKDANSRSYYSVPMMDDENKRVSPIFLINDPEFICDAEYSMLYKYVKKQFVKRDNYDEVLAVIMKKPFVMVFQGCDDGHACMRFTTEEEAKEFLSVIDVFEDIFEFDVMYLN